MLKVVSNSSPLIHLAKIGRLELLEKQFAEILVPTTVWREAVEEGGALPDADILAGSNWIRVLTVADSPLLRNLRTGLHAGEAEAIALALEINADLVLLDETEARHYGEVHGLHVTGLMGVLLAAYEQRSIPSLKDCLDLLEETGFYLSEDLRRSVLRFADERDERSM